MVQAPDYLKAANWSATVSAAAEAADTSKSVANMRAAIQRIETSWEKVDWDLLLNYIIITPGPNTIEALKILSELKDFQKYYKRLPSTWQKAHPQESKYIKTVATNIAKTRANMKKQYEKAQSADGGSSKRNAAQKRAKAEFDKAFN